MNTDVETYIRDSYPWSKLPGNIRQVGKYAQFLDTLINMITADTGRSNDRGHNPQVDTEFSLSLAIMTSPVVFD